MIDNKILPVKPQSSGRLLPESEAVEYLGLGDRPNPQGALRWLMRSGKLTHFRLAKGIYGFRHTDLDAFIEATCIKAGWSDQ
jgi:hypothetical protein